MEENIKNEVVEMMANVDPETLAEANEALLNKAIVETAAKLPAEAHTKPVTNGKTIALGVGTFLGGLAAGAAIDHWVVPAIGKGLGKLKAKRAAKKAERAAKKAAAKKAQEKPANPANEAPATDDAPDPREHDTNID